MKVEDARRLVEHHDKIVGLRDGLSDYAMLLRRRGADYADDIQDVESAVIALSRIVQRHLFGKPLKDQDKDKQ
jgi:hypothetical protein